MANPILVDSHSDLVSSSLQLGTITLNDGNKIAIYEVRLSERVDIVANRVGIRNLLVSDWKLKGCVGAFMFCFKEDESVLRFSYVSETWTFSDDGKMQKESTDTKRFTYLLGAGHRSRTAIGQFEKLRDSALTLKDLTKAFSLEALSDRFFEGYKGIYEDIIEAVTGKRMMKISNKWEEKVTGTGDGVILREFSVFDEPEKAIRDYVKNLMGRIVFLQFLQKKGWLGVPIDKAWGSGDKEFIQNLYSNCPNKSAFIDDILEVLFDDINSKREDDIASSVLGKDIKVPYLNGGLFEKSLADTLPFKLKPEILDNMFKFFGEYNFTIDENDPDDAEIGVDPEMLGRIFENLLEDNKDKGAFYTPKEIVQYMCKESLIAYLQTGVNDKDKEAIRSFVMTYDIRNLSVPLQQVVDKKLKDVKICDPAIGSGAFPMGLLKELFECRSAIEGLTEDNASEIKKHIIQNNIYGVDIEKGAVDIARLRFWLALIVDEKTPHALPNMDFKIMQGNSLLESYEGIDLSELMDNSDDEDEDEPVRNLWGEIEDGQLHLTFKKKGSAKKLRGYIDEYYSVEDHTRKKELFNTIESIIREQIAYNADLHISQAETQVRIAEERIANRLVPKQKDQKDLEAARQELTKYERIREEAATLSIINNQFFLWHTWFSDVFNRPTERNGFDIVIGNPPYIRVQNMNYRMIDTLKQLYKTAYKRVDISICFIEHSEQLLNESGHTCFISSNQFMTTEYGERLREFIITQYPIVKCIDFGDLPIFSEALTYVSIMVFRRSQEGQLMNYCAIDNMDDVRKGRYDSFAEVQYNSLSSGNWNLKNHEQALLFSRMEDVGVPLHSIGHCNAGLITGCDELLMFSEKDLANLPFEKDILLPVLRADSCSKYHARAATKYVIYPYKKQDDKTILLTEQELSSVFPRAYQYLLEHKDVLSRRKDSRQTMAEKGGWYGLVRFGRLDMFKAEKIISPGEVDQHKFCIDRSGAGFSCARVFAITIDSASYQIEYILAVLNSSIMRDYIHSIASLKSGGYYQYSANILNRCPIPVLSYSEQVEIVSLVRDIEVHYNNGEYDLAAKIEKDVDNRIKTLYFK